LTPHFFVQNKHFFRIGGILGQGFPKTCPNLVASHQNHDQNAEKHGDCRQEVGLREDVSECVSGEHLGTGTGKASGSVAIIAVIRSVASGCGVWGVGRVGRW